MNTSTLIQPEHLRRRAVVYVRQSSPSQVINNRESQLLQYSLTQRACQLGWHEGDVQTIDTDLGQSAATTEGRPGFQELVAQVALGEIGLLIAYDATRLARNCSNWYQLLDLCGRFHCLIADQDGVYDPGSINGRLLLGLKGQIAELELHTLSARLMAGLLSKAQRGELALTLPAGLVRQPSGEVIKHPDREVQDRMTLIFEMLLQEKSVRKVTRYFYKHDLQIPRRDRFGDIYWRWPTATVMGTIVKNPAYAGAFVYGRTRTYRNEKTGKPQQKSLPMEEWKICLRDKYPAYISWETFVEIQEMLHDNYNDYDQHQTRGIPREGKGLLQGLIYCGECGHKMGLQYRGGTLYLCDYLHQQHNEPLCQRLPADPIDDQVVRWFFEALSVAEIDVARRVLQQADEERGRLLASRRQQVQRLQYQEQLAQRQFHQVDPDNRLVAAQLESRWEESLRQLKEAEATLAHEEQHLPSWAIPADLLEAFQDIGPRLPELWNQGILSWAQKKTLLRCLIDKVVIHRTASDKVMTRVVWHGGAVTSGEVPVPVRSFAFLSNAKEMEQAILDLVDAGVCDEQIAEQLTNEGYRSPRHPTVLPSTVKTVRLRQGVIRQPCQSHPRRVPGHLTVSQLAEKLEISTNWIHHRIYNGTIRVEKDTNHNCYLFPDKPDVLRKFRQLVAGNITELGF